MQIYGNAIEYLGYRKSFFLPKLLYFYVRNKNIYIHIDPQ
jgi:hypothetical protein